MFHFIEVQEAVGTGLIPLGSLSLYLTQIFVVNHCYPQLYILVAV